MTTDTKPLAERLRAEADILDRIQHFDDEAAADAMKYREIADTLDAQAALLREAADVLRPFAEAYKAHDDPGISDLYNEQPVAWHVPLGVFRRARTLLHKLTEATKP